jgi:hypothetical protein
MLLSGGAADVVWSAPGGDTYLSVGRGKARVPPIKLRLSSH